MRLLLYLVLLILISCETQKEKAERLFYSEKTLGFYDPYDEDFTLNKWIRSPENIRTLHETFKKYGYTKIFTEHDLSTNPCMIWSYINKPCRTLIDSLILTYPQNHSAPKYYKEFWNRRRVEQNDTTVYEVLKEIKEELINKNRVPYDNSLTNDTIYNLLRIKFQQPNNQKVALENFKYLSEIGLNLSAYNLLFEAYSYGNLDWDKDSLREKLKMDTAQCCPYPLIVDDTK